MVTAFVVSVLLQTVGGLRAIATRLRVHRLITVGRHNRGLAGRHVPHASEAESTLVASTAAPAPRGRAGARGRPRPEVRPSADGLANLIDGSGLRAGVRSLVRRGQAPAPRDVPRLVLLVVATVAGGVIYRDLSRPAGRPVVE